MHNAECTIHNAECSMQNYNAEYTIIPAGGMATAGIVFLIGEDVGERDGGEPEAVALAVVAVDFGHAFFCHNSN